MKSAVEYILGDIAEVTPQMISELKNRAYESPDGKYRYCFHKKNGNGLQEMLLAVNREVYLRPHVHKSYAETQILLEGRMNVALLTASGMLTRVIQVGPEKTTLYRIESGIYHMNIPLSNQVVLYEVRDGGFGPETSEFPKWAPTADQEELAAAYRAGLEQQIEEYFREGLKSCLYHMESIV